MWCYVFVYKRCQCQLLTNCRIIDDKLVTKHFLCRRPILFGIQNLTIFVSASAWFRFFGSYAFNILLVFSSNTIHKSVCKNSVVIFARSVKHVLHMLTADMFEIHWNFTSLVFHHHVPYEKKARICIITSCQSQPKITLSTLLCLELLIKTLHSESLKHIMRELGLLKCLTGANM